MPKTLDSERGIFMANQKQAPVETDAMINDLVEKAQQALEGYMSLNQEQVDKIVHAMTLAGLDQHLYLAKLAVEETGRGVVEDKVIKNSFATEYIWHSIKNEKTVGVVAENEMEGYVEVAEPVGVIAGVTPVTNPTSTTMFKSLIATKTRNPIIFAVHPSAQKCSVEAASCATPLSKTARRKTASSGWNTRPLRPPPP